MVQDQVQYGWMVWHAPLKIPFFATAIILDGKVAAALIAETLVSFALSFDW